MKKLFFYLLLIPGIFLVSCDEDEETPTSTGTQRYFALYFDVDRNSETNVLDIDANFWTSDLSEVPTVTINGVSMENFGFEGGLYGNLNNLQYANTVNYSISLDDKTTTGSIDMPSDPYNVLCNGISIEEGQNTIPIPQNNSFNISWLCNSYDYFYIYWSSYNNYSNDNITVNNYTFYYDGLGYYYFSIYSYKGPILMSGSQPNVTGDYGKGYVFAESDGFNFDWYYYSSSIQKLSTNIVDDKARITYYKEKFNELISTK